MLWDGFLVLSDGAGVVYKVTAEYAPETDRGIVWSHPAIAVAWPVESPVLSPKDTRHPLLRDAENNFICGEV